MRDIPGRQSPKDYPNNMPNSALGPAVVVQRVLRIVYLVYLGRCPETVFQAPKQRSRPANRAELQADRAQGACLLTFSARI
jgi:hypothetical protein